MKAAIMHGFNRELTIEEIDLGGPRAGEVLVSIKASGVCHSDWHALKGDWGEFPIPLVLGHEGAGVVEEVGDNVTAVRPGDHVIIAWRTNCGICEMCQHGWPSCCLAPPSTGQRGTVGGGPLHRFNNTGTFATHTIVPEVAPVVMPKEIPFAQAALIGCGVMTGFGAAVNTARVRAGSTVAVFGCGGVGLNCIQGARVAGAEMIIAVDLRDNKLELGRRFGATHTVNTSRDDALDAILTLTGGAGVHYAFEAIGVASEPYLNSVRCTRRRGVTVWVGHAPLNTPVQLDARDLFFEKTVIGSFYGSARTHVDFLRILALYREGKLLLDELVSSRLPLEQVNTAFESLAQGDVARSVLIME